MNCGYSCRAIALITALLCVAANGGQAAGPKKGKAKMHVIQVNERLLTPEDGLLLGNGDLSVSVYQTADRIVFRLGKGEVWDRRLDLSDDPKPAHIDEIARGIRDEGWKCGPYGGPVEATKGTQNPERMKEICQGAPPSYTRRPYPCPKPVGELALYLPPDQMGMTIRQTLAIEEATLTIACAWPSGVKAEIECFIPPAPNVLAVRWKVSGWNDPARTGNGVPPLRFALYRWPDPPIREFGERFAADYRHDTFLISADPKAPPLPPPSVRNRNGLACIEQTFPADPTFKEGFRYLLVPFAQGAAVEPMAMPATGEARLHIVPPVESREGAVAVAVTTSSDPGGPEAEAERIRALAGSDVSAALGRWAEENRREAAAFWARSSVSIADALLENAWYETYHARRSTTRRDTIPPGLFLPSTVQDYSHWHGDYHTNYNLQEPFSGDYTANHLDIGDGYFQAIQFFLPIGRKIARDYYNCRGVFIQLTGYPILAEEDPLGVAPMGRMAYMTGWAANQYWWRYLYTLDKDWLRETGYPVIRDAALFYTDFLKKGEDGLYHAFPSNQGEDGFSGNPKDYTDRAQIMQHLRYCLRAAVRASEVLETDENLRAEWKDRLARCAGDDGQPPLKLTGIDKICEEANPPEFGRGMPYRRQPDKARGQSWPAPSEYIRLWYFGHYPWMTMGRLRSGAFIAEKDFPVFRENIRRWRHPNGLIWGMAVANYGHAGAWTESLGAMAPLQEMMLQSWDGAIRLFPAWPRALDARFATFRAEGAFLVSASWKGGRPQDIEILSEKGSPCTLYSPWEHGFQVRDSKGKSVPVTEEPYERFSFPTQAGEKYTVLPADGRN
ncbi:MAG: hypothetical protein IT210_17260 [Armatimonadetes bacterium]|nr:hypothetical protein [Armatimonadota bacterium]